MNQTKIVLSYRFEVEITGEVEPPNTSSQIDLGEVSESVTDSIETIIDDFDEPIYNSVMEVADIFSVDEVQVRFVELLSAIRTSQEVNE